MTKQAVSFKYETGIISDGYSFSAYNNVIKLPEYVKKLENIKVREAIQYEAMTARTLYVYEVKK